MRRALELGGGLAAALLFAFGTPSDARAGDRPGLSMAGSMRAPGPSEAEVRAEVIRRLEARIKARRAEAEAQERAAAEAAAAVPARRGRERVAEVVDSPPPMAADPAPAPVARPPAAPARPLGFVPPEILADGMPLPPEATRRALGLPPALASVPPPAPPPTRAPPAPGPVSHVLRAKETLWGLAQRYRTSVAAIEAANRIVGPQDLTVGRILVIPPPGASPGTGPGTYAATAVPPPVALAPGPPGGIHTVAAKDTLFKIAKAHQVTVDELIRANPDLGTKVLAPGMKVRIPSGRSPGVPATPGPAVAQVPAPSASPSLSRSGTLSVPGGRPAAPVSPSPEGSVPAGGVRAMPGDAPSFQWPIQGTVTSNFGWKEGKPHTGLDIAAPQGTPVKAAAAGKVIYSDPMRDYGNVVILDHENGYFTVYGHNQENLVSKRTGRVVAGQVIARVGASGDAVAPQLHFEVRKLNQAVDPTRYLAGMGSMAVVR